MPPLIHNGKIESWLNNGPIFSLIARQVEKSYYGCYIANGKVMIVKSLSQGNNPNGIPLLFDTTPASEVYDAIATVACEVKDLPDEQVQISVTLYDRGHHLLT
jgi:hypothetical protein